MKILIKQAQKEVIHEEYQHYVITRRSILHLFRSPWDHHLAL